MPRRRKKCRPVALWDLNDAQGLKWPVLNSLSYLCLTEITKLSSRLSPCTGRLLNPAAQHPPSISMISVSHSSARSHDPLRYTYLAYFGIYLQLYLLIKCH